MGEGGIKSYLLRFQGSQVGYEEGGTGRFTYFS